jgi:general secretion pathway protein K
MNSRRRRIAPRRLPGPDIPLSAESPRFPGRGLRPSASQRGRPPPRRLPGPDIPLSAEYPRFPGRGLRPSASQRGIALIAVLWLTVLITVIASSFAYSMRGEALAARNTMSLAQARAIADGAVERMAFELSRPRTSPDAWNADGQPHSWNDGDAAVTAAAFDESSRIDLNTATDPLLKGLLQNVGGLDPEAAQRALEAILDWRDADELRRPNGAEAPDYRAAGLKYVPTNSPFESVGELRRVLGVTSPLMAKLAPALTVYSRQRGINLATATRGVLLALPTATPEQVDAFIAARSEALANRLPLPPFAPAQGFAAGAAPVWRISARVRLPDGVTFARDAVLRPLSDPRRPLVVLLWEEGGAGPEAEPSFATGKPVQENETGKP